MNGIIKFIWLAVIFATISAFFPLVRDLYISAQFGSSEAPYLVSKQLESVSLFLVAFKNVAASIWLYWLASKYETKKLPWFVFGMLFGLIAVALFYLVRINENTET